MFDSLDEQMKHDDSVAMTRSQRAIQWLGGFALAAVVLGCLYLAIQHME